MSSPLAISGVTAVLQYYLGNVYSGVAGLFASTVKVSCVAPDIVLGGLGIDKGTESQVNIFLHQVTHNAAWRNMDLPSVGSDGTTRLTNQALALDLHYLLTVYGSDDWQAEALLGYALMMLHETPIISRADIRSALAALPLPGHFPGNKLSSPLGTSGLADQIEMIKITPSTLGREELAWLWTALKSDYRPTYPFQVSVVLMEPQTSTTLAAPVLQRNLNATLTVAGQLLQVATVGGQSPQAKDTVKVMGVNLVGMSQVLITSQRLGIARVVPLSAVTRDSIAFTMPDDAVGFPAGVYDLVAQSTSATGLILQSTNSVPLAVSPILPTQVATVAVVLAGGVNVSLVTVNFTPQTRPGQSVFLFVGAAGAPAQTFASSTGILSFQFSSVLAAGPTLARLLVDGVVSQTDANIKVVPPVFLGPMVTI